MEYACPMWFLHTTKNINTLEHVQLRAARWAAGVLVYNERTNCLRVYRRLLTNRLRGKAAEL